MFFALLLLCVGRAHPKNMLCGAWTIQRLDVLLVHELHKHLYLKVALRYLLKGQDIVSPNS